MKTIFTSFFVVATIATAQSGITAPQVGFARDRAGVVRSVTGLAGNFLLGDPAETGVLSAAFSGRLGVWKTANTLEVADRNGQIIDIMDAPDGPAVMGFSTDGATAVIYYRQAQTLFCWHGGHLTPLPFDATQLPGDLVAAAVSDRRDVILLVQREDALWRVRLPARGGSTPLVEPLPGVHGPALATGDGRIIYRDEHGLVIRAIDQTEVYVALDAPDSLAWLGGDWVHTRTGSQNFAVRLTAGRVQAFLLPEAAQ